MADYFVGEGNKIGYLPTEFGESGNSIVEKKIVASAEVKKGQLVEISSNLAVAPAEAQSAKVIGVAMFDAKKDDPVSIETEGLFKMVAGAGITAGDELESFGDGKVSKKSTGKSVGMAINTALTGEAVFVKFSI